MSDSLKTFICRYIFFVLLGNKLRLYASQETLRKGNISAFMSLPLRKIMRHEMYKEELQLIIVITEYNMLSSDFPVSDLIVNSIRVLYSFSWKQLN